MSTSEAPPRIATLTVVSLFASTLVPVWASATPGEPSIYPKIIDGTLVVVLAVLLILLHRCVGSALSRDSKAAAFEVCRWVAFLPLILFAIYTLGAKLKWDVLLIGLGWRSWYLVTVTPMLIAARGRDF